PFFDPAHLKSRGPSAPSPRDRERGVILKSRAQSPQIGLVLHTAPVYLPGNCPGAQETAMTIDVARVPLEEVLPLRELYRREMGCQIVHDSLPGRGFGDLFLIRADGRVAGYGFVMGYRGEPRDMVQEFYVLPALRGSALPMFRRLVEASGARRVEA